MRTWSYRPELDGLRTIAVYLVVLFHAGMAWAGGGFIGVDLFFVLSGFLVSSVVLAEVDREGSFDLGRFYSRRVRRLLPAAVLVIVITCVVQVLVTSQTQRLDLVSDARAALLYFANWQFISDASDYFAADIHASPFLHFWSLSIEEQFYIAFPLVLLLVLRFAKHPQRTLFGVMVCLTLVSIGLQVWRAGEQETYAYYATETRIYQITAGVLLALLARWLLARDIRMTRRGERIRDKGAGTAAATGVLLLLVLGSGLVDMSPSARGLFATVGALMAIGGTYAAPRSATGRLLGVSPLRYLGQISYGTYLWHWPVILVLAPVLEVRPLVLALLAGISATALAALSHQLLEMPIRQAKVLQPRPWPVVMTALASSVAVALVVVPPVLESERRPALVTGDTRGPDPRLEVAGHLDRPVPGDLDLVSAKGDVPRPGEVCTPGDLEACEAVAGDGQHVMLVGDSHAQMFKEAFEALARDRGWRLSTNVIGACPWQQGVVNQRMAPEDRERCTEARSDFYDRVLPKMDVDVVVAMSMSRSADRWRDELSAEDGTQGETLEQLQNRTVRQTAEVIQATGAQLIIAKSVMGTEGYDVAGWDPLDCLARAERLAECAVTPPLERPAIDGIYDSVAAEQDRVSVVDLNPVLCPGSPLCSPVVGGEVVWRDPDHITASFAVDRRDGLWRRLARAGMPDR